MLARLAYMWLKDKAEVVTAELVARNHETAMGPLGRRHYDGEYADYMAKLIA